MRVRERTRAVQKDRRKSERDRGGERTYINRREEEHFSEGADI